MARALRCAQGGRQPNGSHHPRRPLTGRRADEDERGALAFEPAALRPFIEHALDNSRGEFLFPDKKGEPHKPAIKLEQKLRSALAKAGIVESYLHKCRRCAARGSKHHERHAGAERRRCPKCQMLMWSAAVPAGTTQMTFRMRTCESSPRAQRL